MWKQIKINKERIFPFLKKYEPLTISISNFFLTENYTKLKNYKLFVLIENKKIKAIALLEELSQLHVFSKTDITSLEAQALVEILNNYNVNLYAILGQKNFVDLLISYLKPQNYDYTEYFYLYKKLAKIPHLSKNVFLADVNDIDDLVDLQKAYLIEEVISADCDISFYFVEMMLEDIILKQGLFYYKKDGEFITKANVNSIGFKSLQLGGVFTKPEYRGKGLAKKTINKLIDYYSDDYQILGLFVKKKNPAANKLYKNLGFKNLDNYSIIYINP